MRSFTFVLAVLLALAGCVTPAEQEDVVQFLSPGSFEAALADDAQVLKARADPGVPGTSFPAIPMRSAELDAAWGTGRYALESIHWWGPTGPPSAQGGDGVTHVEPSAWQGFLVSADQMQVLPGEIRGDELRALADQFLQNVTNLSQPERSQYAGTLLANCDVMACTAPAPQSLAAESAWRKTGGLGAVTLDDLDPARGRQGIGSWWFNFEFDVATLRDSAGEGSTTLEVGSNDVVGFTWRGGQQHNDRESFAKLQDVLEGHGMQVPASASLEWTHQEISYD